MQLFAQALWFIVVLYAWLSPPLSRLYLFTSLSFPASLREYLSKATYIFCHLFTLSLMSRPQCYHARLILASLTAGGLLNY